MVTLTDAKVGATSMNAQSPRLVNADSLSESDLAWYDSAAASSSSSFNKVYYEEPGSDQDILNLSRSLFDLKEYRKCAHILTPIIASASAANREDSNSIKNSALI